MVRHNPAEKIFEQLFLTGYSTEGATAPKPNFHSSIEKKIGNRTIADICYGVKGGGGAAKPNRATAPSIPGPTAFGKPPTNPTPFSKKPISAPEITPAFVTGSHQPFQKTAPSAVSQTSQNVFQNGVNTPTQTMNVFQKAAANLPNQPNVFQKALHTARSSTPPLVSAFRSTGQATATAPPVSVFASANGTLNPAANVFKPVAVNAKPSGFFSSAAATTSFSTPTQPPAPQGGAAKVSSDGFFAPRASPPSAIPIPPQSVFQLGSPNTTSSGFFQPRAASSPPQPVFEASPQTASGGLNTQLGSPQKLFQSSISTSYSPSPPSFEKPPRVSSAGLFQPNASSPSLRPSSAPSTSLFQSQPTQPIATNSSSGVSIFESRPVQKNFPTNFFDVPSSTPNDREEENDDDAYRAPAPVQTRAGSSLFGCISTEPVRDTSSELTTDTPKAAPSVSLASSFPFSSPVAPVASSTVPVSSTSAASLAVPAPPATHQLVPVQKPLLSRSAAWGYANSVFDDFLNTEVTKVVQEAIGEDKARAVEAIAAEKYAESEKLVARKLALDVAAEQFYAMRSGARIFYTWKTKGRRLMMKRRGEERRRNPPVLAPVQWRPVKVPETAFDGPYDKIQHMNYLTYKSVPLKEIFQPKVEAAFWPTGEGDRKWRLLLNSTNGKEDINNYWWIEKMIGNGQPRISMSKKGTFEAQFKLSNPNVEAREIGGFVFGCSADYSISNEERFAQDKQNLHAAVDWLSNATEFKKLAVMVVCYRSPLDKEDADPYGRDMGRTSGPGRRGRIAAVSCQSAGMWGRSTYVSG